MRRLKLVLIGIKDCWGNESETYFKCPKCERGVITYWKDNTIGYRMSEWYKCPVCGFDVDSGEWERFVVRAPYAATGREWRNTQTQLTEWLK